MSERARRPRQNYIEMGLKPGDLITFADFPEERVEIADEHYLRYRGKTISLTELRRFFGKRLGKAAYHCSKISVNGQLINDLYDHTYGRRM